MDTFVEPSRILMHGPLQESDHQPRMLSNSSLVSICLWMYNANILLHCGTANLQKLEQVQVSPP